RGEAPNVELLQRLRKTEAIWKDRQVCAWDGNKLLPVCGNGDNQLPFAFPAFIHGPFSEIVRDHGALYLRAATVVPLRTEKLMVVSSEALDEDLVQEIANNLGEITLYQTGLQIQGTSEGSTGNNGGVSSKNSRSETTITQDSRGRTVETNSEIPHPTF